MPESRLSSGGAPHIMKQPQLLGCSYNFDAPSGPNVKAICKLQYKKPKSHAEDRCGNSKDEVHTSGSRRHLPSPHSLTRQFINRASLKRAFMRILAVLCLYHSGSLVERYISLQVWFRGRNRRSAQTVAIEVRLLGGDSIRCSQSVVGFPASAQVRLSFIWCSHLTIYIRQHRQSISTLNARCASSFARVQAGSD
jgi:hypothetical protein